MRSLKFCFAVYNFAFDSPLLLTPRLTLRFSLTVRDLGTERAQFCQYCQFPLSYNITCRPESATVYSYISLYIFLYYIYNIHNKGIYRFNTQRNDFIQIYMFVHSIDQERSCRAGSPVALWDNHI
jgi:hypothetical protein